MVSLFSPQQHGVASCENYRKTKLKAQQTSSSN